jgi:hypothetical protein
VRYRSWCKDCEGIRKVAYRLAWKQRVMTYYGGMCVCCFATEIEFLTIDHIGGGGQRHRRTIHRKGGEEFYRWLSQHGFPKGYQVLCFNCNTAKGFYGYCPHTTDQHPAEQPSERMIERSDP